MSKIVMPASGGEFSDQTNSTPRQHSGSLPHVIAAAQSEDLPITTSESRKGNASPLNGLGRLHPKNLIKAAYRISVVRTLYVSTRFGCRVIVMRGTRLRLARGAKISVSGGSRLILGLNISHATGMRCSLRLLPHARLTVHGNAEICCGANVLVCDNAHLELGRKSYINFNSTVVCFDHIVIGSDCAISWNTNMLDGNAHELTVREAARPRTEPIVIGDKVWIGTGATIMPGVTIGDGAVVGAASVVTADVPSQAVVAGNPAHVVLEKVAWRL
jgi:acetyltransferase-like isoleucine patch superfamily enzyme